MPCSNCLMLKPRLWIPNKSLTFSILKKKISKGVKEEKETENVTCGICY